MENVHDLDGAILKAELAVSLTPEDHSNQAHLLSGLGNMLSDRYSRTDNIPDLKEVISRTNLELSTTPDNHPDRG